MDTARATPYRSDPTTTAPWIFTGARNGLIAGLAMAMVMMVLGVFDQGLLAAPSSIWAFWAGPAAYHPREVDPSALLGAMGHMMNAAALGIAFAFFVPRRLRLGSAAASVMAGVAVALAVLAALWYLVLPLSPNGAIVKGAAAVWIWVAGHVAFGMTAGLLSWGSRLALRSPAIALVAALVVTALAGGPATAAGAETGTSGVFTIGPGHVFVADVPAATSTLVRTSNGISVSVRTSGLAAGHAVTIWALIFNDPTACTAGCDETAGDLNVPAVQGAVFHVTGHVVSGNEDSFAGRVDVGDAANTFRGPGLLDPYGARIHLIVRDHGVAGTGELLQQQFNDISPRFCNVTCFDAQKSIHLPHQ